MADSTEHETNRVTSGRRALIAAWVRQATDLPTLYAVAGADASAALVEDGWPTASRSLLARLLDPTDRSAVAPGHDRRVRDRRTAAMRLVEVGAAGPPTRFEPRQARRLSTPLLDGADVMDSVRAGER